MNPRLQARADQMREDSHEPQAREGFAKLPNVALLQFARLMSGNVQILSVLYINAENQWNGERRWTRAITYEELAKVTRTTVRAVELKVKDLIDRKVLEAKKTSKGTMYHIPFETWSGLPDMPEPVAGVPVPVADSDDTPEQVKLAPAFETRFRVEPGKKTKPIKIKTGPANEIEFHSNVPFECDGASHEGILRLYITGQTQREQEAKPNRTRVRADKPQVPETTEPSKFQALHALLDDYCLSHHGTIPNDALMSKIQKSLGGASLAQFKAVVQARIRGGKLIPMGLFVNLAEDARLASEAQRNAPKPAQQPPAAPAEPKPVEITDEMIVKLLKNLHRDPYAQEALDRAPAAQVEPLKALLRGARK
jgi:hypothetical protein